MKRIALLGGTFNPIHTGHLAMAILFILFFAVPSSYASDQVMYAATSTAILSTSARYVGIMGDQNWVITAANDPYCKLANGGTFRNLYVELSAAPGAGKTRTVELFENNAGTGVTCTVSDAATTCSDTTNTNVSVAGDNMSYKITANTGSADTFVRATITYSQTDNASTYCAGSGNTNMETTSTTYWPFAGPRFDTNGSTDILRAETLAGMNATVSDLYCEIHNTAGAGGSGNQYDFTVYQNGAATSLTCSIFETAASCTDVTNSFAVDSNDTLSLQIVPTSTPNARQFFCAVKFTGGGGGGFVIPLAPALSDTFNGTRYAHIFGAQPAYTSTESDFYQIGGDSVLIDSINAQVSASPGAGGDAWDVSLREDASTTAVTCQILDTATTCTGSGFNYALTNGNDYALQILESGTANLTYVIVTLGAVGRISTQSSRFIPLN